MSRTKKGRKEPGYDYWSRRPCGGRGFGPSVKDACHRSERMQGKERIQRDVRDGWEDY